MNCGICKHFKPSIKVTMGPFFDDEDPIVCEGFEGECRILPPVCRMFSRRAQFPIVTRAMSCSQFEPEDDE
jgi:hypothetical protein